MAYVLFFWAFFASFFLLGIMWVQQWPRLAYCEKMGFRGMQEKQVLLEDLENQKTMNLDLENIIQTQGLEVRDLNKALWVCNQRKNWVD